MPTYGPWQDPPVWEEHIWPGTYPDNPPAGRRYDEVQTDNAPASGWTFVRRNAGSGSIVNRWIASSHIGTFPAAPEARPEPSISAWLEAAANPPGFSNDSLDLMLWPGHVDHDGSHGELPPPAPPGNFVQHDLWDIHFIEMWMAHIPKAVQYLPPESEWPAGVIDVEWEFENPEIPYFSAPTVLSMEVLPVENLSQHYSVFIKKAGHGQADLPTQPTKFLGGESGFNLPAGTWDDMQEYQKVDDGYVFSEAEVAALNTVARRTLPAVGSTHPDFPVFPRLVLTRVGMPPIPEDFIFAGNDWDEDCAPDITVRLTYTSRRWRYVFEDVEEPPPEPPTPSISGQQGSVRRRFSQPW